MNSETEYPENEPDHQQQRTTRLRHAGRQVGPLAGSSP